ncbi:Pkinase-domain-containing protein [Agrocybe pediades]|nr:Pkinase-domain-containing protein [Agrocybe pediades]
MADGSRKRALSDCLSNLAHFEDSSLSRHQSLCSAPHGQHEEQKAGSFSSPALFHEDATHSHPSSHTEGAPRSEDQQGLFASCHANPVPPIDYNLEACLHSSQFPAKHKLEPTFVERYQLEDELGSGGYGFVMTAYHRSKGYEVAVKFIIKDKVPEHAWMDDPVVGRLPTEVILISGLHHPNIVKCLDLFEDSLYFYLVQELHGSPWDKEHTFSAHPTSLCRSTSFVSTPVLSPSSSETSLPASTPNTPPHQFAMLLPHLHEGDMGGELNRPLHCHMLTAQGHSRPEIHRRSSHDLFECIEQSEHKKLTEDQARYVFAQVADAVDYLHRRGIVHRDIKDENLVIDKDLKVKLIDFGSAIAVDPLEPPASYNMFYGTAAYASSEILLKKDYHAAPAEIWTMGILLSYLLAGVSPFPTARDAVEGRIFLSENVVGKIGDEPMDLMRKCLDPNPETRATISEILRHPWLRPYSRQPLL